MRFRSFVIVGAAVALMAGPAVAKDPPGKAPFANPVQNDLPFKNCSSKGQILGGTGKTQTQVQIKLLKLLAPDGVSKLADTDQTPCTADDIICITNATTDLGGDSSTILRGEVKKGNVIIKHDLCKETDPDGPGPMVGLLCPPTTLSTWANDTICYEADAAYAQLPTLALPAPNQCMGVVVGSFAAAPSSAILAREGATFACP
jgi:hypothetical protein